MNELFIYLGCGFTILSYFYRVFIGYKLWKAGVLPSKVFIFWGHHTPGGGYLFVGAPLTWVLGLAGFLFIILGSVLS